MRKDKAYTTYRHHLSQYDAYIKSLIKKKMSFRIIASGNVFTVYEREYERIFLDIGQNKNKGFHLCKLVRAEAERYMDEHPDFRYTFCLPEARLMRLAKINRDAGKLIYSVDVNQCYWDTAYHMGFISEKVYLSGMKKPEFKIGRNASIGSLAKKTIEIIYKDGIEVKTKSIPEMSFAADIRNAVVSHVANVFNDLIKMVGDKLYMCHVDSVYVERSAIGMVQEYLKSHMYKTTVSEYKLLGIKNNVITWYDAKKDKIKSAFASIKDLEFRPDVVAPNYFLPYKFATINIPDRPKPRLTDAEIAALPTLKQYKQQMKLNIRN